MGGSPRLIGSLLVAGALGLGGGIACRYTTAATGPAPVDSSTGGSGTADTTSLTYTRDVQPILAVDCVRCHGRSRPAAGYDLSTYAAVLRTLSPGNPNSLLIAVTRRGGVMYGAFSGDANQKAATVYNWIVNSGAAQ